MRPAVVALAAGLLFGSAAGTNNAYASGAGLQQRYDLAYAQCMAASGNRVQQALPAAPFHAPYYYRPYAYPAYYTYPAYPGPWFGPAVSVGFIGGFGHHHHGGFHRH